MPYANYYKCSVPSCDGSQRGRGFCFKHYQRFMKYGDPLFVKHTEEHEKIAFIRTVALKFKNKTKCLVWPFKSERKGGRAYMRDGPVSRVVCKMAYGKPPSPKHVAAHFVCGDELCVNPHHLRWSSKSDDLRDTYRHGRRVTAGCRA